MKIGDKVRFLNEVGGGIIKGFQGKDLVLVEDADGFDVPVNKKEVVVIDTDNDNLERIQPKENKKSIGSKRIPTHTSYEEEEEDLAFEAPVLELKGGDILNVSLAYVPEDIKIINATSFDAYLVNDSNYYLQYIYMSGENKAWKVRAKGEIAPNMKTWLESFMQSDLNELEHICIQLMAYKKDKAFELHPTFDVALHLDTVKFYKMHCFDQSDFFEQPAMIYHIVKDNIPYKQFKISAEELKRQMVSPKRSEEPSSTPAVLKERKNKSEKLIIDLHIEELLDSTVGMSNSEILNYQLDKFRETMKQCEGQHGQHIIFIHGKGNGVLRTAIINELKNKHNYSSTWQDASFQEYGFGATDVMIR